MEITREDKDGIVFITMTGRLDAATAAEAEETMKEVLEGPATKLLFDLSHLEYLSSGGLRVLLGVMKAIKVKQGNLVLCALNAHVKEIFEVSGFHALIPIADTIETGIQKLSE